MCSDHGNFFERNCSRDFSGGGKVCPKKAGHSTAHYSTLQPLRSVSFLKSGEFSSKFESCKEVSFIFSPCYVSTFNKHNMSIVGFDYGTRNATIAVIRKGKLDIATNECSSRYTPYVLLIRQSSRITAMLLDLPLRSVKWERLERSK